MDNKLVKLAASKQSLGLRALHLLNSTRRSASKVKGAVAKLSAGGLATGASAGYFTGGIEGTRRSQMDAYKHGLEDHSLVKQAGVGNRLFKIVKNKLTPSGPITAKGVAKLGGTVAAAGLASHLITGAAERKLNNAIGNMGGINDLKERGVKS